MESKGPRFFSVSLRSWKMASNLLQANLLVKKLEPDVVTFGGVLCALQKAGRFFFGGKLEGGNWDDFREK